MLNVSELQVLVMRVGVLGGGLQGCCVALSLAQHGIDVTLFDRNDKLLSRAAVANEGKIHLGYMYANDPSHSTARMMMRGALAFAPFFARHLGLPYESLTVSRPAAYVVHRDSQRTPDEVSHYIAAVHALIRDASGGRGGRLFRQGSFGPAAYVDGRAAGGGIRPRGRAGDLRYTRGSHRSRGAGAIPARPDKC